MENIDLIQNIPKTYTAIAEWLSCFIYIAVINKSFIPGKKKSLSLLLSLLLLIIVQGIVDLMPLYLWIPDMIVAVLIMYATIYYCTPLSHQVSAYWVVRAFIAAEMIASLEWQIYYFFSYDAVMEKTLTMNVVMVLVYSAMYGLIFLIENHNEQVLSDVTKRELLTTIAIGIVCFSLSNLSYVYSNTPFSSPLAREAFNIRTLMDLGGYAFLLAYHIQLCEEHMKSELDAIQNILRAQYSQYRQSKESIEIINHKYHDLKHQINILRSESNPEKKEAYLDEIENGIKSYESMFKTGNGVLDTLLTNASLKCSRHNITFTCVADGSLLNNLYVMDLCTILGNALDNAIEYEVQIEDKEKRLIHVTVSKMNEFVLIKVENYLQDKITFAGDLPKTTKGDPNYHGFGMKSMRYSVEKYKGTMTVSADDNWFVINILIPK